MGRKCLVFGCKTGYQSSVSRGIRGIPMYGFPLNRNECQAWIHAMPNKGLTYDIVQNKSKCVCILHWPPDFPTKLRNRHRVPAEPPSLFSADRSGLQSSIQRKNVQPTTSNEHECHEVMSESDSAMMLLETTGTSCKRKKQYVTTGAGFDKSGGEIGRCKHTTACKEMSRDTLSSQNLIDKSQVECVQYRITNTKEDMMTATDELSKTKSSKRKVLDPNPEALADILSEEEAGCSRINETAAGLKAIEVLRLGLELQRYKNIFLELHKECQKQQQTIEHLSSVVQDMMESLKVVTLNLETLNLVKEEPMQETDNQQGTVIRLIVELTHGNKSMINLTEEFIKNEDVHQSNMNMSDEIGIGKTKTETMSDEEYLHLTEDSGPKMRETEDYTEKNEENVIGRSVDKHPHMQALFSNPLNDINNDVIKTGNPKTLPDTSLQYSVRQREDQPVDKRICPVCHQPLYKIPLRVHLATHFYYDSEKDLVMLVKSSMRLENTEKEMIEKVKEDMVEKEKAGEVEREEEVQEEMGGLVDKEKEIDQERSVVPSHADSTNLIADNDPAKIVDFSYKAQETLIGLDLVLQNLVTGQSGMDIGQEPSNDLNMLIDDIPVCFSLNIKLKDFVHNCLLCNIKFITKRQLIVHKQSKHKTIKKCDICFKNLANSWLLKKHKRLHHPELYKKRKRIKQPGVCELCGMVFTETSKLKFHLKLHEDKNAYQCDICHMNLSNPFKLKTHRKLHQPELLEYIICETCGKTVRKDYMKRHQENSHGTKIKYRCGICGQSFDGINNYYKYIKHRRMHTNSKQFYCELCGNGFYSETRLKVHTWKIHHQADGKVCLQNQRNKYPCKYCGKVLSEKRNLKEHENFHINRGYRCEICLKQISGFQSYKRHKTIHTGERPFECNVCHRSFRLRSNLREHCKTHTDVKPYSCKICGRNFRQDGDRRKHEKRHDSYSNPQKNGDMDQDLSLKS